MARQFTPNAVLIKPHDEDEPRALDTSKPAVLYIRRSTPGQEENEASLILQDEKMEARLRRKGFTAFIKIAVDDLTSAQEIEREGIGAIKGLAKKQAIGCVAAHNASRLWRDRTHVYDNQFIDLLAANRIPVIFSSGTYWPNDKVQREKLQDEFKIAAQGLNQFELVAMDFHFPPFEPGVPVPHIALPHDSKGYRCQTRAAIVGILSNVAYLGWYAFSWRDEETGEKVSTITSKTAHDAIIEDLELFHYSYDRLSKYTLDGEPNENKPEVERHIAKVHALLEGLITNGSIPVYAMSDGTYTARESVNSMWKTTALVIPIARLDAMVSQVLKQFTSDFLSYCNTDIDAKVQQVQAETTERLGSLADDLAATRKGIHQWELAEETSREAEDKPGLLEAKRNLVKLRNDEATIEAAIKQASSKAESVAQSGELLHKASYLWDKWSFDKRRNLVTMLVERVDIAEVSPHILLVRVYFNDVLEYAVMDGYMFRKRGSREIWSDEENTLLRRLYPSGEKSILLEELPRRTFASIHVQASVLELQRQRLPADIDMPNDLSYSDYQAMQRIGMDTSTRADVWTRNESAQENANVRHNHPIPVSRQKRK
ncbi:MAG TPA: recombinase family protein [Ktedonobacteraceae bacterium]|nr:recombinase family protein [Ktedonobacteraceae bacterium]